MSESRCMSECLPGSHLLLFCLFSIFYAKPLAFCHYVNNRKSNTIYVTHVASC